MDALEFSSYKGQTAISGLGKNVRYYKPFSNMNDSLHGKSYLSMTENQEYKAVWTFISGRNTGIVIAVKSGMQPDIKAGDFITTYDKNKQAYDAGEDVAYYGKGKYDSYEGFWHNKKFVVERVYKPTGAEFNPSAWNLSGYDFYVVELMGTYNLQTFADARSKTWYAPVFVSKLTQTTSSGEPTTNTTTSTTTGNVVTDVVNEKIAQIKQSPDTKKYALLGGGALLIGVITYFMFRK